VYGHRLVCKHFLSLSLVASFSLFGWGFALNYYGHAAVRYTLPNGTQRVMNITGVPGLVRPHIPICPFPHFLAIGNGSFLESR